MTKEGSKQYSSYIIITYRLKEWIRVSKIIIEVRNVRFFNDKDK